MTFEVGDEAYYRHVSGIEQGPVRVLEVNHAAAPWPYRVVGIDDGVVGVVGGGELSEITAVGALKDGAP